MTNCSKHHQQLNKVSGEYSLSLLVQRTLILMTAFVTKDFAVKLNLLLQRNLIWTCLKHE